VNESARLQRNATMLLQLHPVFGARIVKLIAALERAGYRPRIQQAWRSQAQQQTLPPGTTEVAWSFHNAEDADGKPEALAVDLLDDDSPVNPRQAYVMRLAIEARALHLETGLLWGLADGPRYRLEEAIKNGRYDWVGPRGWDPLHVQPSDVSLLQAKHGLRPILAALLVLMLAATASAQSSPHALRASMVAAIAAQGADLSTTAYCLGAKTCHELNPALAWAQDKPIALGFAKMGIAAGLQVLTWKLSKTHPRAAFWGNVAQCVVFSGIAVRNARLK
jgi:hypothetical protein